MKHFAFPGSQMIRGVLTGLLLCTFTLRAANSDNVSGTADGAANFTPGQTYTISGTITYDTAPLALGLTVTLQNAAQPWVFNTATGGFVVSPASGATASPGASLGTFSFGYITAPASGTAWSVTFDVPEGSDEPVTATVTVQGNVSGTGTPFAEDLGTWTVQPPTPPLFTNPTPATGQENEPVIANLTNTVVAGQQMQFQVTISASAGQALTATGFAVGPAIWDATQGKWDLDYTNRDTWFTYTPPNRAVETGYVDFSDQAGTFSRTVNGFTHTFGFTPIAGAQDGTRTFTWAVPAGFVTKATAQNDRVFVVSIGGIQDNQGSGEFQWTVRVDPVNSLPVITQGDTAALSVDEDGAATLSLDATDQDPGETATLTWTVTSAPDHGAVVFVAATRDNNTGGNVLVQYTPTADYFGTDAFVVQVSDVDGGPDTITVNVTVNRANDPPVAVDDALTVEEDSTNNTVDVLNNDSTGVDTDEDKNSYTIAAVDGTNIALGGAAVNTAHGSVTLATEDIGVGRVVRQVLRYTPTANYFGTDTFTYTINDENGAIAIASVTITINNVNDPPTANDDAFTVAEDSGDTVVDVLLNDTDAPDEGETLTVIAVTQGSNGGTVQIAATGKSVTYHSAQDFFGTETFTYTLSDGNGGTATATVTMTVTAVNDPPVADAQSVFIQKGQETSKNITLTGSDVDNVPGDFTFAIVANPTRGAITNFDTAAGTLTYTVTDATTEFYDGNPAGPQADTFTFTISDNVTRAVSTAATVTITYRENQPPVVVAVSPGTDATPEDPAAISEVDAQGQANSLAFSAEFTDDNDPSGQGAMASIKWYVDGTLQQPAERASLQDNFTLQLGYDTVTHPAATRVIEVKAVGLDNQGGTTEVVWQVTVNDVDRDPPAPSVSVTPTSPKTTDDLTANIDNQPVDPDGDAITAYDYLWNSGTARPAYTTQVLGNAATKKGDVWQVTVTPKTDPYGNGDVPGANTATATVTVVNTEPLATAQAVTTDEDVTLGIQLAGVDPDVDDGVDALVFAVASLPLHGTLSGLDPATGTVTYTPSQDYNGTDSFTFTVTDGGGPDRGISAPATVDITVNAVNDAPVAANLTTYTPIDQPLDITLQVSDVDDGQTFTFTIVTQPQHGVLAASRGSTGTVLYQYTPDSGYAGPDYFEYQATDDGTPALNSNLARVDIAVGTPPWFPILSWSNLGIVLPTGDHPRVVYRVQVFGTVEIDQTRQGVLRRFLDTWIVGTVDPATGLVQGTSLLPVDYDTAGNPGLLPNGAPGAPADHYSWHVRAFVSGAAAGAWVDGQDFTIDDYGLPGQGQTIASGLQGDGSGLYEFQFDVTNAAKYEIEIINGGVFRYHQVVSFQRRPDGTVEFVGPFTHSGVFLPPVGPFQWRVRGWNPLGWGPWSDYADEPGPTAGEDNATPSKPIPVGEKLADSAGNAYYQMPSVPTDATGRGIVDLQWSASHTTAYFLVLRRVAGRTMFRGIVGDVTETDAMPDGSYSTDGAYYRRDPVAGLKPGQYVWFVRGFNANAVGTGTTAWGPWSSPCFFEVLEPAHETRPGRVEVLRTPIVADNGDGTGSVTFFFDAQNAVSYVVKVLDPNRTPRRFRTYVPTEDGAGGLVVDGAVKMPMTRPAVYQVWAVGADGAEGPRSPFHVIRPPVTR
ncbi:MAG: tandem-95 repeat protein [Kiritimatiellaeota bacterium]|nr:tandem-95 repeat protein [Kiritimatiellota bacterium]